MTENLHHTNTSADGGCQENTPIALIEPTSISFDVNNFAALKAAINNVSNEIVITIADEIISTEELVIASGKKVSIEKGAANRIYRSPSFHGTMITVQPAAELDLFSIYLDGFKSSVAGDNGAIVKNSGKLNLYGACEVKYNHGGEIDPAAGGTELHGAGIFNSGTAAMLFVDESAEFAYNEAVGSGGAIFNGPGAITTLNGKVNHNTADKNGGAVENFGTLTIGRPAEITENTATEYGGAVYCETPGSVSVTDAKINYNGAKSGGGIYLTSASAYSAPVLSVAGACEFQHDTATDDGGAIFIGGNITSAITIGGTTLFSDNVAQNGDGGAIYTAYANLAHLDVTSGVRFSGNYASKGVTMKPEDAALHNAHIMATKFTSPYTFGYNNYDISYGDGSIGSTDNTVTFDTGGGSTVPPEDVKTGGKLTKPADPTRGCDIFEGWFTDTALTKPWDFDDPVTGDMTLHAKWTPKACVYDVTFNTDGGDNVPAQNVTEGNTIVKPATPKRGCDVFAGWFSDAALTKPWDFADPVTADMTLYAKWIRNPCDYNVSFVSNGGSAVPPQGVEDGDKLVRPADPKRPCYKFEDWYTDEALTKPWDFNTPVTGDMTLYAKWSDNPNDPDCNNGGGGNGDDDDDNCCDDDCCDDGAYYPVYPPYQVCPPCPPCPPAPPAPPCPPCPPSPPCPPCPPAPPTPPTPPTPPNWNPSPPCYPVYPEYPEDPCYPTEPAPEPPKPPVKPKPPCKPAKPCVPCIPVVPCPPCKPAKPRPPVNPTPPAKPKPPANVCPPCNPVNPCPPANVCPPANSCPPCPPANGCPPANTCPPCPPANSCPPSDGTKKCSCKTVCICDC